MKNETSINNFFLSDGQTALPKLTHGSLFSGIGGFDLAAEWIGWKNIFQCEIDKYCTKLLTQHFPNVTKYGDIREFDGTKYRGAIDIISGGFPCQPFSLAGQRKGKEDARHLWPEMFRVIKEIRPTIIVGENGPGIIGMALDTVLSDLESEGYHTETFIIPACAIGAIHRRDRVWIIAYDKNFRLQQAGDSWEWWTGLTNNISNSFTDGNTNEQRGNERQKQKILRQKQSSNTTGTIEGGFTQPIFLRGVHGIPNRVDRIKGLGNAIVPQVAFQIFIAIDFVLREGKKNY